jgi:hypothetical protein
MTLIMLGTLLVFVGVVFLAAQPLYGRLSGGRRLQPGRSTDTLEPPSPTRGLAIKSTWPGLVLIATGGLLLLIAGT